MARTAWIWIALGLAALPAGAAGGPGGGRPQLVFETSAVTATGFSPGGSVVWFGVERRVDADFSADIVPRYRVTQAAKDGAARLDLDRDVAQRSIWVAVDLQQGAWAAGNPSGYRLGKLDHSPCHLEARGASQADAILDARPFLLGLVVRPGQGAWMFGGGDGGPRDEDGVSNGRVSFSLASLPAVPGGPGSAESPGKADKDDLWFVIDPLRMEISVLRGGIDQ